jgi:hypothetical protein
VDSEEQKVDTVTATEETASSELLEPEETVEETSEAEEKKGKKK